MAYLGKTDTMKVLANQNRQRNDRLTWQQMFAATDIAAQQATSAVDYNFAKEVSDAYDASLLAKSNVYSGDYRTGTQNEMLDEIDLALNDAYNKSIENYNANVSAIYNSKTTTNQQINELLGAQADKVIAYDAAHLDYVNWLATELENGNIDGSVFNNTPWSRIFTKSDVTDADGNVTGSSYTAVSADDLRNMMYDKDGNLTLKGIDIYDMLENDFVNTDHSFQNYLETRKDGSDLLEWATSYNPYDYTSGTNVGNFKEIVGLASTDEKYSFIERFGGMNEDELNDKLTTFTTRANDIQTKLAAGEEVSTEDISTYISDVIDTFGGEELKNTMREAGISVDDLSAAVMTAYNSTMNAQDTYDRKQLEVDIEAEATGAAYMATMTAAGATIGSAIPIIGTIAGGFAGLIAGTAAGAYYRDKVYKNAKPTLDNLRANVKNNANTTYNNLLNIGTEIIAFGKSQQQTAMRNIKHGK